MATIQTITLEELGVVLGQLSEKAPDALRSAVEAHTMDLLRQVLVEHMSGQDLGVVTGTARRSMVQRVRLFDDRILGELGSPLAYVRAHEEGFSKTVKVRAHLRRITARSTALTRKGRRSRKRVTVGFASVRSHDMKMNITAKRFVRKSFEELRGRLPQRVHTALLFLASEGRPPTTREVIFGGVRA